MLIDENFLQMKFGINELYIYEEFEPSILDKLCQRAALTLDGEDNVIKNHLSNDMILVFNKKTPSCSVIYQFLKYLDTYSKKADFIESNALSRDEAKEIFTVMKSKQYVLLTKKKLDLIK